METILTIVTVFILWFLVLMMFKNLNMRSFKFLVGSIGLFFITVAFFSEPLEYYLGVIINKLLEVLGPVINMYEIFPKTSTMLIDVFDGWVSMNINYECLGIIEMIIFTCLVIFFPFFTLFKKIKLLIIGNLYLIATNIIRLLIIVALIHFGGIGWFRLAHVVIGRVVYFIFTIALYYVVFTRNQMRLQRVGDMK